MRLAIASQTLVFSKTSLQLHRISPRQPRAIYFSDDVYVGWCQRGDVLEIAATDARQGAIFYTLEQTKNERAKIVRDKGQCLTCHATSRTQRVPGYLVRSVYTNSAGHPVVGSGSFTTDHTSPFKERWGGWYVTGTHGEMQHMGNVSNHQRDTHFERDKEFDTKAGEIAVGANVESLDDYFDTSKYLTPDSDIVALMVLEHQTQMHNAITAASFETRQAIFQSFEMNKILDREPDFLSDSAGRRIDAVAENLVRHLLFCDEFPLTSPVAGSSNFTNDFQTHGPRDNQGRSLRQLDLKTRLFRYPCSYLIESPAFDALPDEVRRRVVQRMVAILTSDESIAGFEHLTDELRREIADILRSTKPEFATALR